jgi:hypothetical protein
LRQHLEIYAESINGEPMPVVQIPERMKPGSNRKLPMPSKTDSNSADSPSAVMLACNRRPTHEGVVFIIAGLRDKYRVPPSRRFDEVVSSNIYHNLSSGIDFRVQFLLQLAHSLSRVQRSAFNPNRSNRHLLSHQDFDPWQRSTQ